jgi:hypothetical protein
MGCPDVRDAGFATVLDFERLRNTPKQQPAVDDDPVQMRQRVLQGSMIAPPAP